MKNVFTDFAGYSPDDAEYFDIQKRVAQAIRFNDSYVDRLVDGTLIDNICTSMELHFGELTDLQKEDLFKAIRMAFEKIENCFFHDLNEILDTPSPKKAEIDAFYVVAFKPTLQNRLREAGADITQTILALKDRRMAPENLRVNLTY